MLQEIDVTTDYHKGMDAIESVIANSVPVDCPITHHFVNGVYCREMFTRKGTVLTSKIHKSMHPFILSMGVIAVVDNDMKPVILEAPHFGVTMPGTRRLIYAYEDSIWTTIHRTDVKPESDTIEDMEKAAKLIEDDIIQPHDLKELGLWPS